ncbi:MAG: hypothetical protein VX834_00655 [Myxococcota bacterium]|nr:hypothetical protein [Myxococcota bacterium]
MDARTLGRITKGTLIALLVGCSNGGGAGDHQGAKTLAEQAPINASEFSNDLNTEQRVLYMRGAEIARRLTSFQFEAESSWKVTRGDQVHEQLDRYSAAYDALGNQQFVLETPKDIASAYLHDGQFFVRNGPGRLRQKDPRGVGLEHWGEIALSSLRQNLSLFRPELRFEQGNITNVGGREVVRIKLGLREDPVETLLPTLPVPTRAVPSLTSWREQARPKALSGQLMIDRNTGVLLRSDIRGTLDIPNGDEPMTIELNYQSGITSIGSTQPLPAPKRAVKELRRKRPPHRMLSFFSEHLPKPEPEEEKAAKSKP